MSQALDTVAQDHQAVEHDMEEYCVISHPLPNESTTIMPHETIIDRINRVREDLSNINTFYNIAISPARTARLQKYYETELAGLKTLPYTSYQQDDKIDYLLLKNHLERKQRQISLDEASNEKTKPLLPFADVIIRLCEDRNNVKPMVAQVAAEDVHSVEKRVSAATVSVKTGNLKLDRTNAFRAAKTVNQLTGHLEEWFAFYNGYDPMFTWWVESPYCKAEQALKDYAAVIRDVLVGIQAGDQSTIIGDPIGREGLLADLRVEKIPYTPEEILKIGEKEYAWCELEMKKASRKLGYGEEWRKALEHVKTLYVEPGQQTHLVRDLSQEALDYVTRRDLITVPALAAETIPMYMMSPERQTVNPFFLGGDAIIVSYPTNTMDHEAKLMSMRGNNIHFSRSTVFHELIPGHHLQLYMNARHRSYRQMFETSFSIEGWAFYWEMILWNDVHFPKTPENRIGMLFWRMHRCCRILFSIKFHLGQMTPQECVELLVKKGGHERATAEGEVRRSFAGDYPPLYQAGYMLGALQLYSLRREIVDGGLMAEKAFHDRVMREGQMPIELLRAVIKEESLSPDHATTWKFYKGLNA